MTTFIPDMASAKPLAIENENNKLACDHFIQINLAPPPPEVQPDGSVKAYITTKTFEQVFVIDQPTEKLYVLLVDLFRLFFSEISSAHTFQASGLSVFDWIDKFREKYPKVTDSTPMAIYFYQVIHREKK